MAFNAANLSPKTAFNNDAQTWDYSTSDNVSTVEGSQYFGTAAGSLRINDIVRVTANDGKALYVVSDAYPIGQTLSITKFAVVTSFPSL